ncbi:hypothetical protein ABLO26_11360 [Neobacillus sp. 179-J 1A1 HS]
MKIKENTSIRNLSERKREKLIQVFSTLKNNYILYPGLVIRHTGLVMKNAYELLDEIEALDIIERVFEVHCPKCQRSTGEIYDSLNKLPDEFFCDSCEHTFSSPEGILVVYRVKHE